MKPHNDQVLKLLTELSQIDHEHGFALEDDVRRLMETRFNADLAKVRVHANDWTNKACELLQAKAFSWRNHIALACSVQAASSPYNRKLLAHELCHVVQRARVGHFPNGPLVLGKEDDPLEREADLASEAIVDERVLPHLTADTRDAVRRAINFDAGSLKMELKRQGAVLNVARGKKFACVHLTQGFTDPDIPDLKHNIGNAFTIEAQINLTADTAAEADSIFQGGWTFNFIQVARTHLVSFTWEGRKANEGEVFVIASRPPAWPSNQLVSLDADQSTPFVNSTPHGGSRKRAQPGQPIQITVSNVMGDHPFLRMLYTAPNSLTKVQNFLFEMEEKTEFFSVFVGKDPAGKFHHLGHIRWVVQFVARITWARLSPTPRIRSGSLDFDTPVSGAPTDPGIRAILDNPVPPHHNDISNKAIDKAAGERLNKLDSAKRSLLLPRDFFI